MAARGRRSELEKGADLHADHGPPLGASDCDREDQHSAALPALTLGEEAAGSDQEAQRRRRRWRGKRLGEETASYREAEARPVSLVLLAVPRAVPCRTADLAVSAMRTCCRVGLTAAAADGGGGVATAVRRGRCWVDSGAVQGH